MVMPWIYGHTPIALDGGSVARGMERLLDAAGELVGAGGRLRPTFVALQQVDRALRVRALEQLSNGRRIARAAAEKLDMMQLPVLEAELDRFGADALCFYRIIVHDNSLSCVRCYRL